MMRDYLRAIGILAVDLAIISGQKALEVFSSFNRSQADLMNVSFIIFSALCITH